MSKGDDLENAYPDLSDQSQDNVEMKEEEEELPGRVPHKTIKTNEGEPPKILHAFKAPPILGGKLFIPPPPPPGAKKFVPPPVQQVMSRPVPQPPPESSQKTVTNSSQNSRNERRNCIYVRNIPKHYNQSDKLMTFFKNEGQIKEIKVNAQNNSAMVRFIKEEVAIKFVNSNKAIFNRSFITYSLNEKQTVDPELVKERENQEAGKVKKPVEIQMKQIRTRMEPLLVEKVRALMFLRKYIKPELSAKKDQIERQFEDTIALKRDFSKLSYEQMMKASTRDGNEYDWTISYLFSSTSEIDKKSYNNQLLKNYGPISSLELTQLNKNIDKPIAETEAKDANDQASEQKEEAPIFEYIAKVTFLTPRQACQFYQKPELRQERDLEVQGPALKQIFKEGSLTIQPASNHQQERQEEQGGQGKDLEEKGNQLVEITEKGEVRVIEEVAEEEAEENQNPAREVPQVGPADQTLRKAQE